MSLGCINKIQLNFSISNVDISNTMTCTHQYIHFLFLDISRLEAGVNVLQVVLYVVWFNLKLQKIHICKKKVLEAHLHDWGIKLCYLYCRLTCYCLACDENVWELFSFLITTFKWNIYYFVYTRRWIHVRFCNICSSTHL